MTSSEVDIYEKEILLSKLGDTLSVARYTNEHGVTTPIVIAQGCPIDFKMFNLILGRLIGSCSYATDKTNQELVNFWNLIGYTEYADHQKDKKIWDAVMPYRWTQTRLLSCFGFEHQFDSETDLLPLMQEVSVQIKEVLACP